MHDLILEPRFYFYCKDGRVLKNLKELEDEFDRYELGEGLENFYFHVNAEKNDYANWVAGVFHIAELAERIRKVSSAKDAAKTLKEYSKPEFKENIVAKENKEKDKKSSKKSKETEKEKVIDNFLKEDVKLEKVEEKEEKTVINDSQNKKVKHFNLTTDADGEINEAELDRSISEYDHEEQTNIKNNFESFSKKSEEELDKVKLMKKKIYKPSLDFLKEIEEIEEEYSQLYNDVSYARKSGIDVFIPAMKIKNVKPKIAFLKASKSEDDFKRLKKLLSEIRAELKDAEEYKAPDIKQEVMIAIEKEREVQNLETSRKSTMNDG
jgi:hypothetical protein